MSSVFKAAILGQGYVGLPLAIAAAEAGISIIGVDLDKSKIEAINSGKTPVEDITDARLAKALTSGNYRATHEFKEIAVCNVIVICVPTPLDSKLEPDLNALISATNSMIPHLQSGTLVISESTSFPGTLRDVIFPLVQSNFEGNIDSILFASSPERVNPGDKKWDMTNTPRLVGGLTPEATQRAKDFYSTFCNSVIETDTPEIAEAAKILENTFRLVNIALMHELNQLLSHQGIDINKVVDAASTKPYGFMAFRSGVGIGGHCIPVDPMYLTWWARQKSQQVQIVEIADEVSRAMPGYVAKRAISLISNSQTAKRVLVIGVAYKSGLADTRETPVMELITQLKELGAEVKWHDPLVDSWNGESGVELNWDCEVAIVATNQPGISIDGLLDRGVPVLDCTNSFGSKVGVTSL